MDLDQLDLNPRIIAAVKKGASLMFASSSGMRRVQGRMHRAHETSPRGACPRPLPRDSRSSSVTDAGARCGVTLWPCFPSSPSQLEQFGPLGFCRGTEQLLHWEAWTVSFLAPSLFFSPKVVSCLLFSSAVLVYVLLTFPSLSGMSVKYPALVLECSKGWTAHPFCLSPGAPTRLPCTS